MSMKTQESVEFADGGENEKDNQPEMLKKV
jgi:hypothetical protein